MIKLDSMLQGYIMPDMGQLQFYKRLREKLHSCLRVSDYCQMCLSNIKSDDSLYKKLKLNPNLPLAGTNKVPNRRYLTCHVRK